MPASLSAATPAAMVLPAPTAKAAPTLMVADVSLPPGGRVVAPAAGAAAVEVCAPGAEGGSPDEPGG
jgi:hypothetical protein